MNDLEAALYIVPTPIGNKEDITFRAVRILKSVDIICAEDTRHSLPLLEDLGVAHPVMESFHDHNETEKASLIAEWVGSGKSVAMISDAGTPLISDPGYHLVVACVERGVKVVPLPGPCAAITALEAAGFPTDSFCFEGFLPVKEKALRDKLESLTKETRTMVFYETPRRILDTAKVLSAVFGEREIMVAREMTKTFETFYRTTADKLYDLLSNDPNSGKGEMVVVLYPYREKSQDQVISPEAEKLLKLLLSELPVKKASKIVSEMFSLSKNDLYKFALTMTSDESKSE